ncbi:MAG: hypothetical protein KA444_03770 [Bacteroidia bacterium]|nr:hypothetical protein [Bacteroidia bacterium]
MKIISSYLHVFFILLIVSSISCKTKETKDAVVENPTFSEHIAPIIFTHCTPCHRPGSAAPINLLTYDDVKSRLRTIQLSISSGIMPPWPADPEYVSFREEKILSKNQKELIDKWIENGAPEGDPALTPPAPQFPQQSLLGIPDTVLCISTPLFLKGDNKDKFIMLKIPYELPADTFIRAIEIIPGNKKLVHHINAHLVQYENNEKTSLFEGQYFVDTEKMDKQNAYERLDLTNDDGTYPLLTPSVSNYLPGVETAVYPAGIGGYRIKKRGVLLLDNIHYGPSPIDTTDQTCFNIFYASQAPKRPVRELILGTSGVAPVVPALVIAPNTISDFSIRYQVPEDISLLTINPHMHLLGKKFQAYALQPNGDTIRLIRINNWDFRWQYFYTFKQVLKIPAGSMIVVDGTFDNTESNPLNPHHPPQFVSEREGSMRTTDEMFQFILTWMPYKQGDELISLENPLQKSKP